MAEIKKFYIKNFKGIEELSLNISTRHRCPAITLVGLNESGKTTILEALSNFVTKEETVSESANSEDNLSLVPIVKKANFTGNILVSAIVELTEEDKINIGKIFTEKKLVLDLSVLPDEFEIIKEITFKEGDFVKKTNRWSLELFCKTSRANKFSQYKRPEEGEDDLWLSTVNLIESELPTIAYFPTFLVDVPNKIYLRKIPNEDRTQRFYRGVLQDALDSLGEGLDLDKHVVQRVLEFKESEESQNWMSNFFSSPKKGLADSVIQKISSVISKEVIGSWNKIFSRSISAKSIDLSWNIDLEEGNIPYVTIAISDGESRYALHQRSLGFRWFFLFLLFTRFKKDLTRPTLFLFDEPAANLHARAQSELLTSFEKIIEGRNQVVYSTHSSHMINPAWVPSSYIVENLSINHDDREGTAIFASPPTSIKAISYRQFIAQNPSRTSYFQPILEKLEFTSPLLLPDLPIIVTEGISDFHAFSFYGKKLLNKNKISLIPGLGDSSHDVLISGLIGKGQKFIVILDDDASGKEAAERYREKWLLGNEHISTIGELSKDCSGQKLETLLSEETHLNICSYYKGNPSKKIANKKEIGMYFAEANAGLICDKSDTTEEKIQNLISKAISYLK